MLDSLKFIFKRDLLRLKHEISSYRNENAIWKVDNDITNSAGNLCLHLVGNLNTFIGVGYGNTGYIRNREAEFTLKNVDRAEMLKQVDDVIIVIENTLNGIEVSDLEKDCTIRQFNDETKSNTYFLIHIASHLAYHLGQINYHRRLFDV
ncbi:DUF1572 domain-containing protein [Cellulophaga baltica]|uniref:DUF1572 family protein n=1 Tax=Cellulophaga TaxID=104264 RepID=UPI001C0709ED|nr:MULTISPECIES: DUF1572 family protein [Cellulophaga]MBU2996363.1 DUF1572 domain-containing protein [Cellulophaga baltica]MDO6767759.1 DUF1572 family protein [Cellulophaga sp. 1_MG-2023]